MSEYLTEPIFIDGKRITKIADVPEGARRGLRRMGKIRDEEEEVEPTENAMVFDGTSLAGLTSAGNVKKFAAAGIVTLEQATDHFDEHGDFTGITGIGKVGSEKIAIELGLDDPPTSDEEASDEDNEDDSEDESDEEEPAE